MQAGFESFQRLSSGETAEIVEITQVGLETFGSTEKFRLWLETPNFALGKLTPVTLLNDPDGKGKLMAELIRISYGILV